MSERAKGDRSNANLHEKQYLSNQRRQSQNLFATLSLIPIKDFFSILFCIPTKQALPV